MSRLRRRATEVRDSGAAQRRVREVDVNSAHYKVYTRYLQQTGKFVERETFCHYWRVVLIYVPLRKLVRPLMYLVIALLAVTVAYGVWEFCHAAGGFWGGLGRFVISQVVLLYLIAGALVSGHLASLFIDKADWLSLSPLKDRSITTMSLLALLCLPVSLVIAVVVMVFGTLGTLLYGLQEDHRVFSRIGQGFTEVGRWSITARFGDARWISWLRPASALLVAGFGTLIGLSFSSHRARMTLVVMGLTAAVAGFIGFMTWLQTKVDEQTARLRQEEWRRCQESVRRPQLNKQTDVPAEPSAPSWFERHIAAPLRSCWEPVAVVLLAGLKVIRDFLSLVGMVIVTHKWKICPFMNLPIQLEGEELRDSGAVQG